MFKLTIEDDEGKTTVIPLIRDEVTIGRQEGNTIRLTERNVSRRHARLVRQNGAIFIEDLASYTGVRINGLKIAALTPVREGDHVQIGDYKILLRAERPPMSEGGDRPTIPTMTAVGGPMTMTATAAYAAPTMTRPTVPMEVVPPAEPITAVQGSKASVVAIPTAMDAQPTLPLRRLVDPAATESDATAPARLVVLTTELAGMEFALNRPSVVIGRTDENDITLDHRSISRHHAKIIKEGDQYTIVDLQSANGVRVNGEDYERIELHPGDMLELGHVRVRFVGPFEHYVFDPLSGPGAGRFPTKVAFTLAGVALAAAFTLIWQRMSRPRSGETAQVVAQTEAPRQPAMAPPTPIPATSAPAQPAATAAAVAKPSPQELLAKAANDAKSEEWEVALATLDQLTALTSDASAAPTPALAALRREAADLRRKIEGERQGALAFAKFDEASEVKNYAEAIDRFVDIPPGSLYKKRARPRFEEARALFVSQHLTAADRYRTMGKCAEVRNEAAQVEKVEPRNQLIKEIVRLCKPRSESPVATAMNVPRAHRPKPVGSAPALAKAEPGGLRNAADQPAGRPAEPAGEAEVDADTLIKQAREAWLRQQCGSAIDLSRKALKASPGIVDAYQVIAVCSCSLKDAEGATRAYGKLDDKSRNLVRSLCQKHGIVVGSE